MVSGNFSRFGAAVVAVALAGCGGGGGDSEPAIAMSFSPNPLTATLLTSGPAVGVTVRATITNAPTTTVYAVVVADRPVVQTGAFAVTQVAAGVFSGTVNVSTTLAAGTYSGNFTLRLCKDTACASEYAVSGNNLPYVITVTPQLALTTSVNGVATAVSNAYLNVRSGDVVSVQSNVPVVWSASAIGSSATLNSTPPTVTVTSQTSTSWTGRLTNAAGSVGTSTVILSAAPATLGAPSRSLAIGVTP
ncbi:hypothetical protein [Xylophilus sp. GOD-11R]|uniref:hypothetical protein n=1 Tax=Xylophilus sp. GOD-11R TaxID=3089814 RepID=UPI00298CA8C0|nr:hypothetical protein [Xylophilus sp. GOD-11R]WPB55376.1 hypothetical protein R9X41_14635 [Xylophilus sp. GOD-11R]